jgi:hypothetical protein
LLVQAIEELRERPGDFEVAHGVAADVRSELLEEPGAVVPQGAEVKLLDPAALGVHQAELDHHGRLELQDLVFAQLSAGADFGKDGLDLTVRVVLRVSGFQAVVGEPTTVLVKEVCRSAGASMCPESRNLQVTQLFELVDEDVDLLEVLDGHA